ncbi:DUF2877 domain-containing protein [Microbacterium esteraromaticum]|uniref:oxamate carbamoyltransferase subunit AllH family protein n=1 Tax=Microbacterium esteraromaticum TaxID=57043 RepID=UPI00195DC71A|nr:DUF2877 domain-containing protein [Microbacterium esteraromaticum]MBM7467158.1 hypothetical protein [Microbacterium esteraromaticum]
MTPVATPVALRAHTWDAALEETLSGGSDAPAAGVAAVHSVHARVVNIRCGAMLVALAHEDLDDAPWTIRIVERDWPMIASARVGDRVAFAADGVVLRPEVDDLRITLARVDAVVLRAGTGIPSADSLLLALSVLDGMSSPAPTTPFGALAADALNAGIRRLDTAARVLLGSSGRTTRASVTTAAERLLGLGEGLTPSGDDVLTGLAFVCAHPGFGLTALVPPLRAAAATADRRTTQLSEVTLRAALTGRARRRMHDLVDAVIAHAEKDLRIAVARTAEIGHTSGHDILTGIRLGMQLSASATSRPTPSDQGDHR